MNCSINKTPDVGAPLTSGVVMPRHSLCPIYNIGHV